MRHEKHINCTTGHTILPHDVRFFLLHNINTNTHTHTQYIYIYIYIYIGQAPVFRYTFRLTCNGNNNMNLDSFIIHDAKKMKEMSYAMESDAQAYQSMTRRFYGINQFNSIQLISYKHERLIDHNFGYWYFLPCCFNCVLRLNPIAFATKEIKVLQNFRLN